MVGTALAGYIGPFVLLVILGLPRLWQVLVQFSQPKPDVEPHGYVGWPLWYVGGAFLHTRRAGALLMLGLVLNAVLPGVGLPWA